MQLISEIVYFGQSFRRYLMSLVFQQRMNPDEKSSRYLNQCRGTRIDKGFKQNAASEPLEVQNISIAKECDRREEGSISIWP